MGKTSRDEDMHNRGEKDASEGEYNLPHGMSDSIFTWGRDTDKDRQENEDYNKGWTNTHEQLLKKK